MKRLISTLFTMLFALGINAQQPQQGERFSPEKFEADLKSFITQEASLTPQEAAVFFPVYKEMRQKQRQLIDRQLQLGKDNPTDEKECMKTIRERDELDLDMKRLQLTYHERFLEVLPASKVYKVIRAEDRFHRRMMRNWGQRPGKPGEKK